MTHYVIPRYPVHLIDVVRVVDGSRVTIRPTLPQDAELQREFFRRLSAGSRYSRFMTRLNELPEALVERFASIDYRSHLALLAEVFDEGTRDHDRRGQIRRRRQRPRDVRVRHRGCR